MERTMRSRLVAVLLVLSFTFAIGCSSKPAGDSGTTSTTPGGESSGGGSSAGGSAMKVPEVKTIVVPKGTVLTVRLGEAVGSKISSPGQAFTATLAKAVVVGNDIALAEGASAAGTVTDAKPLGRFKGGAVLSLKLTSVGDLPVTTTALVRTEKGKGKRTGVMVGGGAGLGAIIGGIAGGGKGAAIGALAGAGAGTGGAAFTGNKDIVLPAESAVSFTLNDELTIKK